jgi:DNA-directed RNA polymerase subunit M/transcription elongation factor TFIIS
MKYFCDNCNNLLDVSTSNDELLFTCKTCYASYKSEPDDSLRYEETKTGALTIYQTILANAVEDPATIRAFMNCPKCKHNTAKQVRLGDELRLINICEKCHMQYIISDD